MDVIVIKFDLGLLNRLDEYTAERREQRVIFFRASRRGVLNFMDEEVFDRYEEWDSAMFNRAWKYQNRLDVFLAHQARNLMKEGWTKQEALDYLVSTYPIPIRFA